MTTADELRNRAAFFRNPDYVKHGFPGHLIEPLADELESAADEFERLTAHVAVLESDDHEWYLQAKENMRLDDDVLHWKDMTKGRESELDQRNARIKVLEDVLAASQKLQADMIMRADVGTYEGDHSVQAGATAWWVFCERIKDATAAADKEVETDE